MTYKIVHVTTVHPRFDIRIFYKMCVSLNKNNYDVSLIVADGKGYEISDGIKIYDVGKSLNRLDRIFKTGVLVFELGKRIKADLYHIHDPELIPIGIKLKKLGFRVIFDAHEDVPKQILSKPYLNKHLAVVISKIFKIYEYVKCRKFDGVISATDSINKKFEKINRNVVVVNNYPLMNELSNSTEWSEKELEVCYIGALTSIRGIKEISKAVCLTRSKVKLNICGDLMDEPRLTKELTKSKEWEQINFMGVVNREGVRNILSKSVAGLLTFHPSPNHLDAKPNKMFEYMSASIPVIASDFPDWREFVEENKCGIIVDPMNPDEIADAIDILVKDMKFAEELGKNGREAIIKKFNWETEYKVLDRFYSKVLNSK